MTACHTCPACGGKGTTWSHTGGTRLCTACNGTGSGLRR